MADCGERSVQELLKIEVLETLLESQERVDAYWPHLNENARWVLARLAVRSARAISFPLRYQW